MAEDVLSSVCGPPIAANTAVSKDVGIYSHSLTPSWALKATFKKSSTPTHCLAVSDSHIFAGQDQKAHVHVYSRLRGNQEALVAFPERIRSLALARDVLVIGTSEGRLILWETCTGRQVSTPPCHIQAITCLAVGPQHLLTGSEDSNINVWSLAHLLELGVDAGQEPDLTLSNHRGAITDLVVGPSVNSETKLCVSSSTDKTCMLWDYHSGQVLRTLIFSSTPLCISLDTALRALFACAEDGGLYLIELFGDEPLLGWRSAEDAAIVVQVKTPLGIADAEHGPASCISVSHDGTFAMTGHIKGKILRWDLLDHSQPSELCDLNASVTNLAFVPCHSASKLCKVVNVMKPVQNQRRYIITAQLDRDLKHDSRFDQQLNHVGFTEDNLEDLTSSFLSSQHEGTEKLLKENEELRMIIEEQKALQKATTELKNERFKS